ncbi:YraN family protein [Chengkuizengella axinellae]|uniref:UPF0102 protein Q5Y73_04855 n=1 Tax=Chengkuizengella axinellae TaxID=3064388 RepID=A0ABT9IVQ5_9BACL|nr:YraN family protein [Chengkuizengella sp. 2205SS18-9]MDP5273423.1 YraN family protein [Chengkuizengella sp. 2205SS18-9]
MTKAKGDQRKNTGHFGEKLAVDFLLENKYKVIEKNWRCKLGEVDIIAYDNDTLVILEVRTRRDTGKFGTPHESINFKKQQKVRSISQMYLQQKNLQQAKTRIDVICIILNKTGNTVLSIDHIKNAF